MLEIYSHARATVSGGMLPPTPAHAGVFDDEQARKTVINLRDQFNSFQATATQRIEQKDYYTDLDARLKKFEPQHTSVEDREGTSQPGEKPEYDAALKHFQAGDFKSAGNSFSSFIKKYPQSPYLPLAQYWLGDSLYAQRDYKGSTWVLQKMIHANPTHPKVPDAMIAVANNQFESGQKDAARKTLEQVLAKYPGTEGARAANNRLKTLK